MGKKIVVKIAYLSKQENAPKKTMTPSYVRLIAQQHTEQLQALADRKAQGISLPEDEIEEYTRWV